MNENTVYKGNDEDGKLFDFKLLNEITEDSYADVLLDYTFIVFKSINQFICLIYANNENSIISYNLNTNKKINEIKSAHENVIVNFRHLFDEKEKRDLVLSVSSNDNNLKIWNINNFECVLNLKKVNKKGEIFSSCFLIENNNYFIVTSNYCLFNDPIKVYDFNGSIIKEINDSNQRTTFVDTYYDEQTSKIYIIAANKGFITSFDYNENKIKHKYIDDNNNKDHFKAIIDSSEKKKNKEGIIKLIESGEDGYIRIWNFDSAILIKKIHVYKSYLYGFCFLNDNYILVGCGDKTIKIVELNSGKMVKELIGHNDDVISVKILNLPKYGKCIISQGNGNDQIKLWINQSLYTSNSN